MKRNKTLVIGIFCFLILLVSIYIGPYTPIIDETLKETPYILSEGKIETPPYPPSEQFPLGTDKKGRDLLSLIVVGGRETLLLVAIITLLRYAIAVPLSVLSAAGSRNPLSWLIDRWNQAFTYLPVLITAILYINLPFVVFAENRLVWIIVGLAMIEAGRVSMLLRDQIWELSNKEFVQAGIMIGNSKIGLFRKYYFPILFPQIIVNFVLDLGKTMLLIGQLGLLGIFLDQEFILLDLFIGAFVNKSNAWPQLLVEARSSILFGFSDPTPYWIALAIAFTTITFHLLGEGLRQYFENRHISYIK